MAFDAGILVDATTSMKWDGTKYKREAWNRDQTAATWMRDSVVWFSQELTPSLGMDRVKAYLSSFQYGNEDMSGGLTKAWLESSLLISPDEQLRFLQRFWRGELAVSEHALNVTKAISFVDKSSGWTLHGKTGSGAVNEEYDLWLGWFIGHVAKGDREYVFVMSYTDRFAAMNRRPPGLIARDLTQKILTKLGLY
jgi:beta-lactamase class D